MGRALRKASFEKRGIVRCIVWLAPALAVVNVLALVVLFAAVLTLPLTLTPPAVPPTRPLFRGEVEFLHLAPVLVVVDDNTRVDERASDGYDCHGTNNVLDDLATAAPIMLLDALFLF